jgi:uridine kinase
VQPCERILRLIELHADRPTFLLAIDGLGGAGKTFLAERLSAALEATGHRHHVVHFDDFFFPSAQRPHGLIEKPIGTDFDWARLRDEVLAPLRRGQTARYARYDWTRDAMAESIEVAPGLVIVEGIYSNRQELGSLYDLRVWVECPRALRLERGLERDGEAARTRWENDWMPSEDRYLIEHRPRDRADVIVEGRDVQPAFRKSLSDADVL